MEYRKKPKFARLNHYYLVDRRTLVFLGSANRSGIKHLRLTSFIKSDLQESLANNNINAADRFSKKKVK